MLEGIQTPQVSSTLIQARVLFLIIHTLGLACFAYIVARRLVPLWCAERDVRLDRLWERLGKVGKFWLGQWKHPRYRGAGIMHILVFAGFILLATRAFALVLGLADTAAMPEPIGRFYDIVKDCATTIVFLCMAVAIFRRLVVRPARYAVPARFGRAHVADAVFLLALIAALMLGDSLFAASKAAFQMRLAQPAHFLTPLSLPWALKYVFSSASLPALQRIHFSGFLLHDLTFFFLLCYRPFGIQFHVETSLFSIFFAKLDRGTV